MAKTKGTGRTLNRRGKQTLVPRTVVRQYNHNADKIEVVPDIRWKESFASGDEYRYGLRVNLYHKGCVVKTHYVNMHWFPELSVDGEKLKEMLAEANEPPSDEELARREPLCDHFGCAEVGQLYRRNKHYDSYDPDPDDREIHTVRYCKKHADRGDCAIVDNASNLVSMESSPSHARDSSPARK